MVGVIVGTGTNACYVEAMAAVTKWDAPVVSGCEQTVINVEWGAYTSPLLPRIPEDEILDTISTHPGRSCRVATGRSSVVVTASHRCCQLSYRILILGVICRGPMWPLLLVLLSALSAPCSLFLAPCLSWCDAQFAYCVRTEQQRVTF
jgi:Hexokinase